MPPGIGRPSTINPFVELNGLRGPVKPKTVPPTQSVDHTEVESLVDKAKRFKSPSILSAQVHSQKLTSGKMKLIDEGLEKLGVETLQSNAAKLSRPSTWGKALLSMGITGIKKGASMLAQTALTVGQYATHLGGLTVNLGLLACHKFNMREINNDLKAITPQVERLEQQFSDLEQSLETELLSDLGTRSLGDQSGLFAQEEASIAKTAKRHITLLKLAPLDSHLLERFEENLRKDFTHQLELKSQQNPDLDMTQEHNLMQSQIKTLVNRLKSDPIFSSDKTEIQNTAKNLAGKNSVVAPSFFKCKDIQGKLLNDKRAMQGKHILKQKNVHASISNFSWAASRRIDETLGLREKSIKADNTWDYFNSPDLGDIMIGNINNARSLASTGLSLAGKGSSQLGGILKDSAGPLMIVTEAVGLGADIYGASQTGLRLHKLSKFEEEIETPTLEKSGIKHELGTYTTDALSLIRKNTKQTLKSRIASGLKHASVLTTVGTLVGVGLLTVGTIASGGTLLLAIGIAGGVAYGGITLQKAYKQHMRVQNIQKLETAHANVQKKIDILEAALQQEPTQMKQMEIKEAIITFQNLKGTLETTLRQTSTQHAAMGILADLMSHTPDGVPTPKAIMAHKAILSTGFDLPDNLKTIMQTRDTLGLQSHLGAQSGGNQYLGELRLSLVQSLEQYKT